MQDDSQDDAAVMGVALPEQQADEDYEVMPDAWPVVQMFLRCQTQWRTTMNGLLGLDYGAVAWLLRLYEVEDQRSMLEDLQVMEAAVMAVLSREGG